MPSRPKPQITSSQTSSTPYFRQIASTVNYDITTHQFAGDASVDAEIGYDKSAGPAAALAGIAIFGTSRPGGATVRNPMEALNDEAPKLDAQLGAIGDGILI